MDKNISVKGVHTVVLYVKDLEASAKFYSEILGMTRQFGGGGVEGFKAGDTTILLHVDEGVDDGYLPPSGERGRGVLLDLEMDDVNAFHEYLKTKGVEPKFAPRDQPFGLRQMLVTDPDGYELCFVQKIPVTGYDFGNVEQKGC